MKATIKIELRKDYATKEGKQMVCLRYTAYRRSTLISMNIAVLPKYWNKISNTVCASEPRCYYYNKAISEVYQKADTIVMENFLTFHRARHSFRTIATKKGVRDGIAGRIMGHAEGNDIKDIYTHLHDEDIVKEVRDKWVV